MDNILVLGLGNLLLRDEGLGVQAIEYLKQQKLPESLILVDGGTGGFHLLSYFEDYKKIIIIDAALDNKPTGSIRILRPKYARDFPKALTTHDVGLKDLIDTSTAIGLSPEIVLIAVTIQPKQSLSMELSDEIKQVLPQIYKHILNIEKQLTEEVIHGFKAENYFNSN